MARMSPLARGLKGQCPRCGGRKIFTGMADLKDECPTCGLEFVREEGYWLGAMIVIMALVIISFTIFLGIGLLATWPDVPWTGLTIGGLVVNAIVPMALYGWSKTVWMGIDHSMNPPAEVQADEATA